MQYFCDCATDNLTEKEILIQSMRTLDNFYSVVGILEMYNKSLAIFEEYLPGQYWIGRLGLILFETVAWFRGAQATLNQVDLRYYNHNPHPPVLEKTRRIMEERLKYDIEFYQFAKQRLVKQINNISKWKVLLEHDYNRLNK